MEFQNQVPPGTEDLRNTRSVVHLSSGTSEGIDRVERGLVRVGEEVRVLTIRVEEMLAEGSGGGMVISGDTSMYVGC